MRFQFWGMSLVETLAPRLTAWVEWENIIYELAKEAKVDVFQLQDFERLTTTDEENDALKKTIQTVSALRNYKGIIAMPLESKFESKQITFASYDEIYFLRKLSILQKNQEKTQISFKMQIKVL